MAGNQTQKEKQRLNAEISDFLQSKVSSIQSHSDLGLRQTFFPRKLIFR